MGHGCRMVILKFIFVIFCLEFGVSTETKSINYADQMKRTKDTLLKMIQKGEEKKTLLPSNIL